MVCGLLVQNELSGCFFALGGQSVEDFLLLFVILLQLCSESLIESVQERSELYFGASNMLKVNEVSLLLLLFEKQLLFQLLVKHLL